MAKGTIQSKTHKMTEGNPLTVILLFAVPMILSNLFQQLYNVIDSILVGKKLGTEALAAVGSAGSITAVFVQLSTGLALGASVVIAQYFGAEEKDKILRCTTTCALFSGGVAVLATILVWIGARPLLLLVKTPEEIVDLGVVYLRFYFLGCVPIFLYNALNGVYVALGNSKTPLRFLMISSGLNVALDWLFIVGLHGGVAGAALATAISQGVAAILALADMPKLLAEFTEDHKFSLKEGSFDPALLKLMLRFALPSALQQSIVSVGNVVVQATINSFGAAVIAGSAAASKVVNLATVIPINYGNALSNYVGQNIGADRSKRIRPGLRASLLTCGMLSAVMTAIFEIFPRQIIRLFVQEDAEELEAVMRIGVDYLRVVGAFLIVFSVYMLLKAVFKGAGDMGWFIAVTLLSFIVRLVLTVGFAPVFGVDVIWWSFNVGWIVALAVTMARYLQGGWRRKSIVKER